jgi:23S rRNA (adenine2503-C2)-methyltransferase
VQAFVDALTAARIPCSVRHTKGLEAAAACGQLRNRHQKEPMAAFSVPA